MFKQVRLRSFPLNTILVLCLLTIGFALPASAQVINEITVKIDDVHVDNPHPDLTAVGFVCGVELPGNSPSTGGMVSYYLPISEELKAPFKSRSYTFKIKLGGWYDPKSVRGSCSFSTRSSVQGAGAGGVISESKLVNPTPRDLIFAAKKCTPKFLPMGGCGASLVVK